jgi:hypothetical protein
MLTADSVERDIAYVPEKGADPRLMLTGKTLPATTENPKVGSALICQLEKCIVQAIRSVGGSPLVPCVVTGRVAVRLL